MAAASWRGIEVQYKGSPKAHLPMVLSLPLTLPQAYLSMRKPFVKLTLHVIPIGFKPGEYAGWSATTQSFYSHAALEV